MILNTLIEHQNRLVPAVVEIELIPGIPQIHFLGLPDKVIKESFFRIKAALKSAGYRFPVSQQVIVNIRPNSLKKSSRGLELAVALGILHLTDQKRLSEEHLHHIIYGELDLNGHVREPDDLVLFKNIDQQLILTGSSDQSSLQLSRLDHLVSEIQICLNQNTKKDLIRPTLGLDKKFSDEEAELIFLMATSGLHTLLAGQAGAGKSYLVKNYMSFFSPMFHQDTNKLSEPKNLPNQWYPVIAPHHSLTPAAFLGGTAQLVEGEIEKVENGILILDELLEFNSQILEALREPMTGEVLRIARAGRVKEIKPTFQVVATSNLCPCGQWYPGNNYLSCRFSNTKCKSHLNRLSGPLVDRFGLIFFHRLKKPARHHSGEQILKRILNYFEMQKKSQIEISESMQMIESIYGHLSGRRLQALAKVAEIYAIEQQTSKISLSHLKKSEIWTIQSFIDLEKGMS